MFHRRTCPRPCALSVALPALIVLVLQGRADIWEQSDASRSIQMGTTERRGFRVNNGPLFRASTAETETLVQLPAEHQELRTQPRSGLFEGVTGDEGFEAVVPKGRYRGVVSPQIARRVLQLEQEGRGRKIISMSIYGSDLRYTTGAVLNAALAVRDWGGWTLRIYHDDSVPNNTLSRLQELPIELIRVAFEGAGHAGRFWRFFALEDRSAARVIFRDIDARLTERDRMAVEEWEESGSYFHVMHDHPQHEAKVMAGLWGAVGGFVNPEVIAEWRRRVMASREMETNEDQVWLGEVLWPAARKYALAHASFGCNAFGEKKWRGFPTRRASNVDFVGNVYTFENAFEGYDLTDECPTECRRKPEWITC